MYRNQTVPVVCSPLSVVVSNGGKKRLVIDLRYLNGYLLKDSFKYEDLRIAMLMFQKGDYLFSFDLKSGYHHVDIHKHHWQYLGFSWGEGDRLQYYEFKVLPFGLATYTNITGSTWDFPGEREIGSSTMNSKFCPLGLPQLAIFSETFNKALAGSRLKSNHLSRR